jgi:L-fuconolactonase
MIVDAHHHLWDPESAAYPWLTEELAVIRRRFDADHLHHEIQHNGVDATVVVQTRSSEDETRDFLAIAKASPFIAGVVGWVDLTADDVGDRIAAFDGPLVGIRHQVHDEEDPSWLERDDVGRGLTAVQRAGLVYDLLVRTREMPYAVSTAQRHPDLSFVLDHLGKPPIVSGDISAWRAAITPLAAQSNVVCKLSGLVTEADWNSWKVDDLRPAVEVALDLFGPDRLLFGSDWPVCLLAGSYHDVKATAEELTRNCSDSERAAIFGGNAVRTYGLEALT